MLGSVPAMLIVDDLSPSCMVQRPKRPALGPKRQLSEAEQSHYELKPYAKRFPHPVQMDRKPPIGTAKPYLPGSFVAREAEYNFLVSTQFSELATMQQELGAMSLSSSPSGENDDDMEPGNIAEPVERTGIVESNRPLVDPQVEHDAKRYGVAPLIDDSFQPILDRIEWERFVLACGTSVRIFAKRSEQTGRRTVSVDDKRWTNDDLKPFIPKLLAMVGDRTIDDIEDARLRAKHYGKVVWSLLTPDEQHDVTVRNSSYRAYLEPETGGRKAPAWHTLEGWMAEAQRDVNPLALTMVPDEDAEDAWVTTDVPPAPPASGPQELHLHDTWAGTATYEPSDQTLKRWSRKVGPRIYRWL